MQMHRDSKNTLGNNRGSLRTFNIQLKYIPVYVRAKHC